MVRVKGGYTTRQGGKKVLKLAKGYYGTKHILYETAHEQVVHSFEYACNDHRDPKRNIRKLWIAHINVAARANKISCSKLTRGLKLTDITISRRMLSEIAIHNPKDSTKIIETAKSILERA